MKGFNPASIGNYDRISSGAESRWRINQMITSQTRLRTSLIAALVNRSFPLTFTFLCPMHT
jgi:hypothetical protein